MMQNCEPYGRAVEGGGGLRLIKHIHTHNGEVGQRGEGGGEEEVWELERNPINARTGFVGKQVSRLHFPHCVFWTPYMKALHHLVKKFAFQWLRNLVKVKDGWMNK